MTKHLMNVMTGLRFLLWTHASSNFIILFCYFGLIRPASIPVHIFIYQCMCLYLFQFNLVSRAVKPRSRQPFLCTNLMPKWRNSVLLWSSNYPRIFFTVVSLDFVLSVFKFNYEFFSFFLSNPSSLKIVFVSVFRKI